MEESKDNELPQITTVELNDPRNYSVIVEVSRTEGDSAGLQTLNLFATKPEEAFTLLINLRKLYEHDKTITNVRLVGVYRRTALKVVEGDN